MKSFEPHWMRSLANLPYEQVKSRSHINSHHLVCTAGRFPSRGSDADFFVSVRTVKLNTGQPTLCFSQLLFIASILKVFFKMYLMMFM